MSAIRVLTPAPSYNVTQADPLNLTPNDGLLVLLENQIKLYVKLCW